jgi:hypothetical protein
MRANPPSPEQDELTLGYGCSPLSLTPLVSRSGSFCDDFEGSTTLYPEDVIAQMRKDDVIIYAQKCVQEFKGEAIEYANMVLMSVERANDKNPSHLVEWLINAAVMLVRADDEETDDEDAPKRPFSARLALMCKNNDDELASAASALNAHLDRLRQYVPVGADEQFDLVYYTVKIRVQMIKANWQTLRKK